MTDSTLSKRLMFYINHYENGVYAHFAKKIGVSKTYIYLIKRGEKGIAKEGLYKICVTYPEINPLYLLEGKGEPFLSASSSTRIRETLGVFGVSLKEIKKLIGETSVINILYGNANNNVVKAFLNKYQKAKPEYIINGSGSSKTTREEELLGKIEILEEHIESLKKINDLLENEINRINLKK